MSFDLSAGTLVAGVAAALAVLLLVMGVGWAVVWLLSLQD